MKNQASDDENNSVNDISEVWYNRGLKLNLVRHLWEKSKIFADNYHRLLTDFHNILVRNIIKLVPTNKMTPKLAKSDKYSLKNKDLKSRSQNF